MTFELGVWMHGYELANSPRARHVVEGLTPDTHAPYCRDALTAVLRACPAISCDGSNTAAPPTVPIQIRPFESTNETPPFPSLAGSPSSVVKVLTSYPAMLPFASS